MFRIGKAPEQGRERCTAGSLALLCLRLGVEVQLVF